MSKTQVTAIVVLLTLFITVLGSCNLLWQWFFNDCIWWTCAPSRGFRTLDLDIPIDLFPSDTVSGQFAEPSELNRAQEASARALYWSGGNGRAIYIVERYAREERAKEFYERYLNVIRNQLSNMSEVDVEISADSYKVLCGSSRLGGEMCFTSVRYKEYTISFSATIDQKFTLQNYISTVEYIDNQIVCKIQHICD